MHSAKKQGGKPLYELAREGIEVDREPKVCRISAFEILNYEAPYADIEVSCSSGTYVRTLAQDFAKILGTVGLLETLHRSSSGFFKGYPTWTVAQVRESMKRSERWDELPCWIAFDRLLDEYPGAEASSEEAQALMDGKQGVLPSILGRAGNPQTSHLAIRCGKTLVAVAKREGAMWELERVFTRFA
jgi:tRNA pseudouridine55 synthase